MKKILQESNFVLKRTLIRLLLHGGAILSAAIVVFAVFQISTFNTKPKASFPKEDMELGKKFVGTRDTEGSTFDFDIYETVSALYNDSDSVVIASFSEQPRYVLTYSLAKNDPIQGVTKYKLKVDTVLKGKMNERMITLSQMGQYESDKFETKLKPDTKYILFLRERNYEREFDKMLKEFDGKLSEEQIKDADSFFENDKILYQTSACEAGVFEILPDETLYAHLDYGFAPSFEGRHYSELVKAIQSIQKQD